MEWVTECRWQVQSVGRCPQKPPSLGGGRSRCRGSGRPRSGRGWPGWPACGGSTPWTRPLLTAAATRHPAFHLTTTRPRWGATRTSQARLLWRWEDQRRGEIEKRMMCELGRTYVRAFLISATFFHRQLAQTFAPLCRRQPTKSFPPSSSRRTHCHCAKWELIIFYCKKGTWKVGISRISGNCRGGEERKVFVGKTQSICKKDTEYFLKETQRICRKLWE